jgi:hypothetical protein
MNSDIASIEKELVYADMPSSYQSIGWTLLAETARRRKDSKLADRFIERITSPCLSALTKRWFLRNRPKVSEQNV